MKKQVQQTRKLSLPSKTQPKRTLNPKVTQVIHFAVVGDSHVGFGSSSAIFKGLLPKVVSGGNKKFVIFGGDNAQAGANHGNNADIYYTDFKNTVTTTLQSIPFKASIGNWEASTRNKFIKYLGAVVGQMNFPGTQGKVKYVWLDNALGVFSGESINLLKNLDPKHYYIIDFHWPLNVKGITVDPNHVLSQTETNKFFKFIPSAVRDKILAIFTHHGHKFYEKLTSIYPGFTKTKFFVCGCSGDYKCKPNGDRGYYDAFLTIKGKQFSIDVKAVKI
jgi:hypothetical protein